MSCPGRYRFHRRKIGCSGVIKKINKVLWGGKPYLNNQEESIAKCCKMKSKWIYLDYQKKGKAFRQCYAQDYQETVWPWEKSCSSVMG